MNVAVIGAGAWGTALGITAARSNCNVTLWSYDGEVFNFDNVVMPDNISVTRNISDMAGADAWLIVTPSSFFRETVARAAQYYNGQPVIICTKGADAASGKFMSEILRETLPQCTDYGVLSGPQFAAEVARGVPTGSTIAGTPIARGAAHKALSALYLQDSDDVIGTEICGVGKNAVALICGYTSVASGENERAMIFTRAWGEVVKIGRAMGARTETFLGLCGIGDLFLSATSPTSRNFSGGMAIARGEEIVGTVEGIFALGGLLERAVTLGVDVPILVEMRRRMKL